MIDLFLGIAIGFPAGFITAAFLKGHYSGI